MKFIIILLLATLGHPLASPPADELAPFTRQDPSLCAASDKNQNHEGLVALPVRFRSRETLVSKTTLTIQLPERRDVCLFESVTTATETDAALLEGYCGRDCKRASS